MPLPRLALALLAGALIVGLLPAGRVVDGLLRRDLEARLRAELAHSVRVVAYHEAAAREMMPLRAAALARTPGLGEALRQYDRAYALRLLEGTRLPAGEVLVLAGAGGELWAGPAPEPTLFTAAFGGEIPVSTLSRPLRQVTVAPVEIYGAWVGTVGVARPLDAELARSLAGLARAEVVILNQRGWVEAATLPDAPAHWLAAARRPPPDSAVVARRVLGRTYLVAATTLGGSVPVLLARDLDAQLAALPRLRPLLVIGGGGALLLALALGALIAPRSARSLRLSAVRYPSAVPDDGPPIADNALHSPSSSSSGGGPSVR